MRSGYESMGRRSAASAAGQTLPMVVLFLVVLCGMAGLVIDLGNGYLQKRSTQNVADAAALAGASAIPQGTWQTAASTNAATNDKPGDQVTESLSGGNTVTVTVTRSSPTYILGLFGVHTIKVTSTAKATIEALGQVAGHVAPYAVPESSYNNGAGNDAFQREPARRLRHDRPARLRQQHRRQLQRQHQPRHPHQRQERAERPAARQPTRRRRLPLGQVRRLAAIRQRHQLDRARQQH